MGNNDQVAPNTVASVQDLARNGRKQYAWRCVDGIDKLVLVGLRFTVAANAGEDVYDFEQRVLRYCVALTALGFPVVTMELEQRAHQQKPPWAVIECRTGERMKDETGTSDT